MKRNILGYAVMVLLLVLLAAVPILAGGSTAYGQSGVTATAFRSMPSTVASGANFQVGVAAYGYGIYGQVVETLPDGFTYVSSTLDLAAVNVTGQVVKFTLLGEISFTYTVTASSMAGSYTFDGVLKDEDLATHLVGGSSLVTVSFSVASYDTNHDGIMSKGEAVKAVSDYFDGIITKAQALEVVAAYFKP